mmetsp:Transcript_109672/g.186511  ORF Transcript_109672/g.186511 Transcript_109672/m.186511 type:complete len:252 (+) Transcript_109672:426-1181(+)
MRAPPPLWESTLRRVLLVTTKKGIPTRALPPLWGTPRWISLRWMKGHQLQCTAVQNLPVAAARTPSYMSTAVMIADAQARGARRAVEIKSALTGSPSLVSTISTTGCLHKELSTTPTAVWQHTPNTAAMCRGGLSAKLHLCYKANSSLLASTRPLLPRRNIFHTTWHRPFRDAPACKSLIRTSTSRTSGRHSIPPPTLSVNAATHHQLRHINSATFETVTFLKLDPRSPWITRYHIFELRFVSATFFFAPH